jgi:hypothetical protein
MRREMEDRLGEREREREGGREKKSDGDGCRGTLAAAGRVFSLVLTAFFEKISPQIVFAPGQLRVKTTTVYLFASLT